MIRSDEEQRRGEPERDRSQANGMRSRARTP